MPKVNVQYRQEDGTWKYKECNPSRIGRPPLTDAPLIHKQVGLTAEQWAKALAIGGSYSAGVRLAVDKMKGGKP